jgi:hypothetical protein
LDRQGQLQPPIANKDGKPDATEIANASVALKTLDKNGDGEITADEMFRSAGPADPASRRPRSNKVSQRAWPGLHREGRTGLACMPLPSTS